MRQRVAAKIPVTLLALALFGLNAVICWPLFRIEYLDDLQSNEGAFITLGKFLQDHWPHTNWFPLFNAGTPFEYTYQPLVPYLLAISSVVTRVSPAHVFHFVAALAYCLAPVAVFLFAARVSGRARPSFAAALFWSLLSPSAFIGDIRYDMGNAWGMRRLRNIVFYGETPHNLALCLVPVVLLLAIRYWDRPSARRFAVCVVAAAAAMLTNAFGGVVAGASLLMLIAAGERWRQLVPTGAMLVAAYLLTCVWLPPSLIRTIRHNSQMFAVGDFRMTHRTELVAAVFVLTLVALWALTRRVHDAMLRFAIFFTACFGGITLLAYYGHLGFVPQPHRYHIEMELGICLLAPFALAPILRRLPRRPAIVIAALAIVPLAWIAAKDCGYARGLIHPLAIEQSVPYRQARWFAAHLPGQRVMDAGEGQYWLNLFTGNPQLGAGAATTAPNWMQAVALFTIYTGENAGDQDGPISVFWLKAFGCSAITVPGRSSTDHYHAIRNPEKFDGLLPLVWREGAESIYQVPLRSASLAHVIPATAVVSRQPVHGLDLAPARAYVAALEDPALPAVGIAWDNPDRGHIFARVEPSQVVSLQITYDSGWHATSNGQPVPVRPDKLDLMILEPRCHGDCTIDLEFTGGVEHKICLPVSWATGLMLLLALGFGHRRP